LVDLESLRELTQELAEEVKEHDKGPFWNLITLILDRIDSYVAILSNSKELLWVNKSLICHCNDLNIDIESLIGQDCRKLGFCEELCDKCPVYLAKKRKQVVMKPYTCNLSKDTKKLICIPLVYNGVSGIIVILGDAVEDME